MNINELSITSLDTITAFGINGGEQKFVLDELQNATISNTQETTPLTGKGGRTLSNLKKNKAVKVSGANGMVSLALMAANTGTEGATKETTVKIADYLAVSGTEATTRYAAVGTAGNEIGTVFVKNPNGTQKKKLTQAATAAAGKFAYDPTTKKITFAEGDIAEGDEIVCWYDRKVTGDVVSNVSDQYSEKLELYVDATAEDKCHNEYHVQFYLPYVDFSGNFDLTMGTEQTVHNFEGTSLASACGRGGTKFWDMIVFGDEETA
ncbi:hypothetical protein [uncultured Neglectibacter sp.]|uniref:hypothetical protein n=1 Tax=uncultured Neglectibacter sp. TaxID=1924108 RepID=UPI0034E056CB